MATIASSFLIRPVDLQKQLSLFREAVELRLTIKDFLTDEIPQNRHWFMLVAREGWTTKEVERELAKPIAKRTKLRDRWRQFVWTQSRIDTLRDRVEESTAGRLLDSALRASFKEKLEKVKHIRGKSFQQACRATATAATLRAFIAEAQALENVDLDSMTEVVRAKLALLRVAARLCADGTPEPGAGVSGDVATIKKVLDEKGGKDSAGDQ